MVKFKDTQFCVKNLKRKRKRNKKKFRSGDLNHGFLVIFPPMIWIFMGSEEDEIKSKQASKKVRTLMCISFQLHALLFSSGLTIVADSIIVVIHSIIFIRAKCWATRRATRWTAAPLARTATFSEKKKIYNWLSQHSEVNYSCNKITKTWIQISRLY